MHVHRKGRNQSFQESQSTEFHISIIKAPLLARGFAPTIRFAIISPVTGIFSLCMSHTYNIIFNHLNDMFHFN